MKLYRIVDYFLIGTMVVYILVETFAGEQKQFHIENLQFPQPPVGGINVVTSGIGTATVYRGSTNYG